MLDRQRGGAELVAVAVSRARKHRHAGSSLLALAPNELDHEFEALNERLADLTVLNLWVVFEWFVVDHVAGGITARPALPPAFGGALQEKISREVERRRFDELLDLYKRWIDAEAVGSAKQIKSYRDWITHRNPKRLPPAFVDPDMAYRVLVGLVRAVEFAQGSGSAS